MGVIQEVFKRRFKGDLEADFKGDLKQDLLSSSDQVLVRSGPGLAQFRA